MRVASFFITMTNKELRVKIYAWLFQNFQLDFSKIDNKKRKELKKILEEFNPTQEVARKVEVKEKVSEWKTYPSTK